MKEWKQCKKILCVRADNMGDVIMSGPAIRAIKKSFGCSITLLTSSMGSIITPFMPEIDETIVYDLPWVKSNHTIDATRCEALVYLLRTYLFDAAIIFTVYSQNSLPTALLTYMAEIPNRLAYCRENPYNLLTHWLPDKEPYTFIQHQVKRDIALAKYTGAIINDDRLQLHVPMNALNRAFQKLELDGFSSSKDFIVVHPGVSEEKRKYPIDLWITAIQQLHKQVGIQIVITGTVSEKKEALQIQNNCDDHCFVACGLLDIAEVIALIESASLLISVNTGIVHIASAVKTPMIVLYAQTNPQHTPWKTPSLVLPFGVVHSLQSSNEVIRYVNKTFYKRHAPYPSPQAVTEAAIKMLHQPKVIG